MENGIKVNGVVRSEESNIRRKENKKRKKALKRKQACSMLSNEKEKVRALEEKLEVSNKELMTVKNKILKNKPQPQKELSSVSRNVQVLKVKSKLLEQSLPNHNVLSENVIVESVDVIGEGTFGIVKVGFHKTLNLKCAIKSGKNNFFNANMECRILQQLNGSVFFPFVFGVFNNKLVMELIIEDDEVKTVFKVRNGRDLEQNEWTHICKDLADALFFLHSKGLLHNDIKSNNILLKRDNALRFFPKIIDMGKITTRKEPHRYRLNERQKISYNQKYKHLAPEIRNVFDTRTSIFTDIYSLGIVFDFVADDDNSVLQTILNPMISEKPENRPNIYRILKLFPNII